MDLVATATCRCCSTSGPTSCAGSCARACSCAPPSSSGRRATPRTPTRPTRCARPCWRSTSTTAVARDVAAIPVVPGEKTPGERFAGAVRTYTIEGMMRDGRPCRPAPRTTSAPTSPRPSTSSTPTPPASEQLCHTTSWGMSTRMIGGVIMTHGDDKGLVLPPALAPYQVVIVPIGRGEGARGRGRGCARPGRRRSRRPACGSTSTTRPQVSPGFKFNDWELKGVPLRLELGPRDLEAGVVILSKRLAVPTRASNSCRSTRSSTTLPAILEEYQDFLLARATAFRDDHTAVVDDWDAFVDGGVHGLGGRVPLRPPACEDDIKARPRRRRATSRPTAPPRPASASAAASRRRTASGSSSAAPTDGCPRSRGDLRGSILRG